MLSDLQFIKGIKLVPVPSGNILLSKALLAVASSSFKLSQTFHPICKAEEGWRNVENRGKSDIFTVGEDDGWF